MHGTSLHPMALCPTPTYQQAATCGRLRAADLAYAAYGMVESDSDGT